MHPGHPSPDAFVGAIISDQRQLLACWYARGNYGCLVQVAGMQGGILPYPGHPSPMLSLEGVSLTQRQLHGLLHWYARQSPQAAGKRSTYWIESNTWCPRLSAAMISSGLAVQVKAFDC